MGRFVQYNFDENRSFRPPVITITKNGAINFNAGMLRKYMKKKTHVILYYDKVGKRIGFEFLSEESKKAFKIRITSEHNFGTIAGRSFLSFYDISYEETNRYPVEIDNETKYIIINLKKNEKDRGNSKQIKEDGEDIY